MTKRRNTCTEILDGEKRCQCYALKDSDLCYFHSPETKEQRALAQKRGGKVRKDDFQKEIEIRTPFNVTALLNTVINGLKNGRIDPKTGNALVYAANVALKALELSEVQRRIEEIAQQIKQQEKYGFNPPPDWDCVDVPESLRLPEALGDEGKDKS